MKHFALNRTLVISILHAPPIIPIGITTTSYTTKDNRTTREGCNFVLQSYLQVGEIDGVADSIEIKRLKHLPF